MARKIQVEIIGDSASLERAFKRSGSAANSFSGSISRVEKGFFNLRKGAFAGGAALGGLIAVGIKSVQAAANLGEQINKTTVVFGKSAASIKQWATTTAASIGISNRAALEAAGTFGNMLVPMGFARSQAAGMSKRMVQLAADMASFNNASPEETLDALRAGLAGETEPLRRFGVFLNQDRIAAEALSKGIVKTTKDTTKIKVATFAVDKAMRDHTKTLRKFGAGSREANESQLDLEVAQDRLTKALKGTTPKLTAQEKAMATYSILLKDTTDAQGDFRDTSDSLPNAIRSIRASVEDLSAAFGEGLLPVVQKVAKELSDRLADPAFRERIRALGKEIGEKLLKAVEAIGRWFEQNWDEIKSAFRTGARLAQDLVRVAGDLYDAFKKIASVTPGGANTLLGAIIGGLLLTKLLGVAGAVKLINTRLALLAAKRFVIPVTLAIGVSGPMKRFFEEALGADFSKPQAAGDLMPVKRGGVWVDPNTGEPVPDQKFWERRAKRIKAGQATPGPRTSGIQPRAHGGPVVPGVVYRVGERGPEKVMFGARGQVIPNGGGGIVIQNAHFHGVQNVREMAAELQRFAKHGTSQTRGRFGGQNLALT